MTPRRPQPDDSRVLWTRTTPQTPDSPFDGESLPLTAEQRRAVFGLGDALVLRRLDDSLSITITSSPGETALDTQKEGA